MISSAAPPSYARVPRLPPPLELGARVAVVAPSGPSDRTLLDAGLALLRERYDVRVVSHLAERRQGFLAGSDEERARELQEALDDPSVGAVWIARGGYGLARILPLLSFARFAERPSWVVGFSDATALHCRLAELGVASLHASNVTGLSRLPEQDLQATFMALASGGTPPAWLTEHMRQNIPEGPVFGGNLTILFTEAASGRLTLPPGCSLLLEDVSETSYRVDRMLTALIDGGHLARAEAFLLGEFTECSPGKFGVPVAEVLRERLTPLGKPIAGDLPIGHGARNAPIVLGAPLGSVTPS